MNELMNFCLCFCQFFAKLSCRNMASRKILVFLGIGKVKLYIVRVFKLLELFFFNFRYEITPLWSYSRLKFGQIWTKVTLQKLLNFFDIFFSLFGSTYLHQTSQNMCLFNTHIFITRHARCGCKLLSAFWFSCVFSGIFIHHWWPFMSKVLYLHQTFTECVSN